MKYFFDNNDNTFVQTDEGIFRIYSDGEKYKTDHIMPDLMWHECDEKTAKEYARICEKTFSALKE